MPGIFSIMSIQIDEKVVLVMLGRADRFSWSKQTKNGKNIQNDHKLYQKALNCTKMAVKYKFQMLIKYIQQHFPFQGPPNFTNVGIFGLKKKHLATLMLGNFK
jgi:hypothetical protein